MARAANSVREIAIDRDVDTDARDEFRVVVASDNFVAFVKERSSVSARE